MKRLYGRTNKNNATKQITRLERRDTRLRRAAQSATAPRNRQRAPAFSDNDTGLYTGLDVHHQISKLHKDPVHLLKFVHENGNDPAKKVALNICIVC